MKKKIITELLKPVIIMILILIGIAVVVGIAKSEPYKEKSIPEKRIIDVTACAKHAFQRLDFIFCAAEIVCQSDAIKNPIGDNYFYKLRIINYNKEIKDWDITITRSKIFDFEMKNACDLDEKNRLKQKQKNMI